MVAKLFDNFRLKCMENKQNFEKFTKVAKNFYLEAQKLLRIYDLRLEKKSVYTHSQRHMKSLMMIG